MAQLAHATRLPSFMTSLLEALERTFPGSRFDVQKSRGIDGTYYRLTVVSEGFRRMSQGRRDESVWDVAKSVLTDDQLLRVTMILPLPPQETNGHPGRA